MTDRKEYFKNYYKNNKEKLNKYNHDKYLEQRTDRLDYHEKYYREKSTYVKERMKQVTLVRRQMIIKAKDKPCMDCGIKYPSYVMQFDHRDPSKKFKNVGKLLTGRLELLQEEIAKCDIVCANCHAERTWGK